MPTTIWLVSSFLLVVTALIMMLSVWKLPPFVALFIAALLAGFLTQMPLDQLTEAVANGFGDILSRIGLAVTFGCVLSSLLEQSGVVQVLAEWMVSKLGSHNDVIVLAIVACLISIPVFFGAAYILLAPLCKDLSRLTRKSIFLYIGTMNIGLLLSCCCVPPAPGPLAISSILGTNSTLYMFYGVLAILPVLVLISWKRLYMWLFPVSDAYQNIDAQDKGNVFTGVKKPGTVLSFLLLLLPVFLILSGAVGAALFVESSFMQQVCIFVGNSSIAMFLSMFVATVLLRNHLTKSVMLCVREGLDKCSIVIVLGIGGSLANVISRSGIGEAISTILLNTELPLYLSIYLISAMLRIALSSGTAAMLTSAGLFAPMIQTSGLSPILAGLSIGAACIGYLIHTDATFWLSCELFHISSRQNLRAVSAPATAASLVVFGTVCLLDRFSSILPGLG